MEGTFQSSFPLAYSVNTLNDLNTQVVRAYRASDKTTIQSLTSKDLLHYDVFICVSSDWHAFLVCVPVGNPAEKEDKFNPEQLHFNTENPFQVPDNLLCPTFELCFDVIKERMYKIRFSVNFFHEIKRRIKKSYYIARYAGLNINSLQFAVLRAAPSRYEALLHDCLEFCKSFCIELLAYSSNYRQIETQVNDNIEKASSSGLSVEHLSRRVRSSGWLGNTFLGGVDMSSYFADHRRGIVLCAAVVVVFVYPVVAALCVIRYWGCQT